MEYYRKRGSRQTLTTRESYEALPPERQGRIRYYQRERPRLAEVEVWSPGRQPQLRPRPAGRAYAFCWIGMPTSGDSGGKKYTLANVVTDADYSTGPNVATSREELPISFEDLGTRFWVDTVEFLDPRACLVSGLQISDGTLAPDGSVEWTEAVARREAVSAWRYRIDEQQVQRSSCIEPTRSPLSALSHQVSLWGQAP